MMKRRDEMRDRFQARWGSLEGMRRYHYFTREGARLVSLCRELGWPLSKAGELRRMGTAGECCRQCQRELSEREW